MPMLVSAMGLNPLLRRAVELVASDIHLKVGLPPILRRDGALGPLEACPTFKDGDMEAVLEIVGKRTPGRLAAFKDTGDLDIAYQDADLPRFRVNAFRQRGHISFAFRVINRSRQQHTSRSRTRSRSSMATTRASSTSARSAWTRATSCRRYGALSGDVTPMP